MSMSRREHKIKTGYRRKCKREAEYEIRIKKLEQNNKENINLKDEVMKLRNDIEEIKKKDQIVTNTQDVLSTEDISSENLERSPQDNSSKQIDCNVMKFPYII
ncbi:hypothetical protein F8M41_008515 [Gigaspora margarita]|uniref:Uncharacterized protein n=1 Tax=Gigaspora margarita TaxID=4874 RepID=A0A8H4B4D9_GIGMA|nr:hypothetical protein F8M41_008515 [Gigaspora margarita]